LFYPDESGWTFKVQKHPGFIVLETSGEKLIPQKDIDSYITFCNLLLQHKASLTLDLFQTERALRARYKSWIENNPPKARKRNG